MKNIPVLKNGPMAKLPTGDMREREIHENFILSQRAGMTCYLCSETTYIGSEEVEGKNTEDERKQMRTKLHI